MNDFSYRLVCLTHGESSTLLACLDSFAKHVTPAPTEVCVVVDGHLHRAHQIASLFIADFLGCPSTIEGSTKQEGFCRATARAWAEGAKPGVEWNFHLESDFVWNQDIDLSVVAHVLERHEDLAQMVFLRGPANETEHAAGGLREARPGEFTEQECLGQKFTTQASFLSTNPFLASTAFMRAHEWPPYDDQCEGRFGYDLRLEGWRFGMWGGLNDGPQVEHIGVRDGFGY